MKAYLLVIALLVILNIDERDTIKTKRSKLGSVMKYGKASIKELSSWQHVHKFAFLKHGKSARQTNNHKITKIGTLKIGKSTWKLKKRKAKKFTLLKRGISASRPSKPNMVSKSAGLVKLGKSAKKPNKKKVCKWVYV